MSEESAPTPAPAPEDQVEMVRMRRADGAHTDGVSWGAQSYLPDADGVITVPSAAAGDLESHGFERVPEGPGAIDQALDDLSTGVAAEGEKVEALKQEALADVPPEAVTEARAEVAAEHEAKTETHEPAPSSARTTPSSARVPPRR